MLIPIPEVLSLEPCPLASKSLFSHMEVECSLWHHNGIRFWNAVLVLQLCISTNGKEQEWAGRGGWSDEETDEEKYSLTILLQWTQTRGKMFGEVSYQPSLFVCSCHVPALWHCSLIPLNGYCWANCSTGQQIHAFLNRRCLLLFR